MSRDGFTLVEMLVTLALMAIIATIMAVSITQLRPIDAMSKRLETQLFADQLTTIIANDLAQAMRLPLLRTGAEGAHSLLGEPHSVRFVAVVPTGFRRRGLRDVRYATATSAKAMSLQRTVEPRSFDGSAKRDAETDTLFDDVVSMDFAYGQRSEAGVIEMQSNWTTAESLPDLIEIRLMIRIKGQTAQSTRAVRLQRL